MNDRPGRPGVDLEIERLCLHDPTISGARAERLRGLIESELSRLLAAATLDAARSATSVRVVSPASVPGWHPDDHQLATSVARAIARAIGEGAAT
jgi:hypothetical protein